MGARVTPVDQAFHLVEVRKPRHRLGLWILGGLLVAGTTAIAFLYWPRAEKPALPLLSLVPSEAEAFAVVQWKRAAAHRWFKPLLRDLERRYLGPAQAEPYRSAGFNHSEIENVAFAATGLFGERRILLLASGVFDRPAVEALFAKSGLQPRAVLGKSMLGDGKWLAGFPEQNLLLFGHAPLVERSLALAAETRGSMATDTRHDGALARVDPKAMIVGAADVTDALRPHLTRLSTSAQHTRRIALSLDDRDLTVSLRVVLDLPDDGEAASAQSLLPEGLRTRATALKAPTEQLVRLAAVFANETAFTQSGNFLTGQARLFVERDGLVGTVANVVLPALIVHERTAQARAEVTFLDRLVRSAVAYYEERRASRRGRRSARFPDTVAQTPAGSSCDIPTKRFAPSARSWEHPTWQALGFSVSTPHVLSFEFLSQGKGPDATFTARASGDIECLGTETTFERTGRIDAEGAVRTSGVVERR